MSPKKLRKLKISGFRGIRFPITIDFTDNYNSVIIYGANAKGKSSIGDAFEWYFSGEVKELTKEGCTREDYRHRLLLENEDAIVNLELSDSDLNGEFSLKSSRRQNQTNMSEEFVEYLRKSKDELLILRHKDLKQFVDESKGDKRKQIAQLIGMDDWEKIRTEMGTVENRLASILDEKKKRVEDRQCEVSEQIGSEHYLIEQCWKFAEEQARKIGIEVPISSLDELRATDEKAKETTRESDRSEKITNLKAAEMLLQEMVNNPPQIDNVELFANQYNTLSKNPSIVFCAQLNDLYSQGKLLLESGKWEENSCPLCGAEIPKKELLSHIQEHQEKNKAILEKISIFENTRSNANEEIKKINSLVEKIKDFKLEEIDGLKQLKELAIEVALTVGNVKVIIGQQLNSRNTISSKDNKLPEKVKAMLLQSNITQISISKEQKNLSPTKEEIARIEAFQNLSKLASHLAMIGMMNEEIEPLEKQVSSMHAFSNGFQKLRRETMGGVLEAISDDVSRYFLALHSDEGFDDIQLKFLPEEDGVEFHIYYKGEEISPPRRFLSESYLNGLGVCF